MQHILPHITRPSTSILSITHLLHQKIIMLCVSNLFYRSFHTHHWYTYALLDGTSFFSLLWWWKRAGGKNGYLCFQVWLLWYLVICYKTIHNVLSQYMYVCTNRYKMYDVYLLRLFFSLIMKWNFSRRWRGIDEC